MKVNFIDEYCKDAPHSIATVNLEVCPKINDRYVIFGIGYQVESIEHTVCITAKRGEPMVVTEIIKCHLKSIRYLEKEYSIGEFRSGEQVG